MPRSIFRFSSLVARQGLIAAAAAGLCEPCAGAVQSAYLKALNSDGWDRFGISVAISGDTAIVGAHEEDGAARGVNGDGSSDGAEDSGAAYIFVRGEDGRWSQQAYLKASNADPGDQFGEAVAISGDIAVVGAKFEKGASTGINGNQGSNSASESGAAYIFVRDARGSWRQEAYLKASNAQGGDHFGCSVAVSDGTVVVGACYEDSSATGVNGSQGNNGAGSSGAAYVFVRGSSGWTQQAYLKASNTGGVDAFGTSVGISGDTIVVGAVYEDSAATGVNGNQDDDSAATAGAAYVFIRNSRDQWSQQAYLKASNTDGGDRFGEAVAISGDTVVVGARWEDSLATGVDGDQEDDSSYAAGAAYVFARNSRGQWSQQAYLKPSNTDAHDFFFFGGSVAVAGDEVVIGAPGECGSSTGIEGDQYVSDGWWNGAVYHYRRDAEGNWSQVTYIKSSNCERDDRFATSVAISDGLAIAGAIGEDSAARGADGDPFDDKTNGEWVGASYVFDLATGPVFQAKEVRVTGSTLVLRFSDAPGLAGWGFRGGTDPGALPDVLAPIGPVVEGPPGEYQVSFDLGADPPPRYFIRVER